MAKTMLRKEIDKEIESKLLLQDASIWQIVKYSHSNHGLQMFECAVFAGLVGYLIGVLV